MKIQGKLVKEKGEKYWGVEIPSIGIYTQGKTKKDAYVMAKDAIEILVDKDGFEVEIEPGRNSDFFIVPSKIGPILSLILKQKRIDRGLTIEKVVENLGQTSQNAYWRYESGASSPSFEKFDQILKAINPKSSAVLIIS